MPSFHRHFPGRSVLPRISVASPKLRWASASSSSERVAWRCGALPCSSWRCTPPISTWRGIGEIGNSPSASLRTFDFRCRFHSSGTQSQSTTSAGGAVATRSFISTHQIDALLPEGVTTSYRRRTWFLGRPGCRRAHPRDRVPTPSPRQTVLPDRSRDHG